MIEGGNKRNVLNRIKLAFKQIPISGQSRSHSSVSMTDMLAPVLPIPPSSPIPILTLSMAIMVDSEIFKLKQNCIFFKSTLSDISTRIQELVELWIPWIGWKMSMPCWWVWGGRELVDSYLWVTWWLLSELRFQSGPNTQKPETIFLTFFV